MNYLEMVANGWSKEALTSQLLSLQSSPPGNTNHENCITFTFTGRKVS